MHLCRFSLRPLGLSLVIASLTLAASLAEAARITKVSGSSVAIDGNDSDVSLNVGDRYFVMVGGKRKAIVQVTKVKGNRAIGKILKGNAAVNGTLEPAGSSSASASTSKKRKGSSGGVPYSELTMGVLAGFAMDSQTVNAVSQTNTTVTESISMSGSGFSLKGFGDMPVSGPIGVTARLGIEQFSVKGKASFGEPKTDIMYVSADLLLRYLFLEGEFAPFAAAGIGLHFPLSKSSDVLDVQRISSTSVFLFNAGANYALSDSMYLTGLAEYGLFPPSNDVKTSFIAIRGGVGMRF